MTTEAAHSPLGPSSAERWLNCPASVRATADLPEVESSFAAEGTVAHFVAQRCQEENIPAANLWDSVITTTSGKVRVTQEMRDAVQEFLDYVNALDGDALSEIRVKLDPYVPGGFGTLDDARMAPGECEITDFKYGKGVQVYAENNYQLMCYALGVLIEYDWLYKFQAFRLNIVQPRLDHIDEWSIPRVDLLKWADEVLKPGALRTLDPDAPFNPGKWCQFCKLKATCKARADSVFAAVVGEFDDLDVVIDKPPTPIIGLTADQIAKALTALDAVKQWCKDLERHAVSEIMQGRPIGDWKLVEGRSNRKWNDEALVLPIWIEAGLDQDELMPRKMIGPTAAQKIVGKKSPVYKSLEALSVKPVGKPKLAPGSDKRPAMVIDPNVEFDELGEDE